MRNRQRGRSAGPNPPGLPGLPGRQAGAPVGQQLLCLPAGCFLPADGHDLSAAGDRALGDHPGPLLQYTVCSRLLRSAFRLKMLSNHYHPGGVSYVMGVLVANRYASWVELVLIHVTSPGTSFVGHLAGILVGFLYTAGPLKIIMKKIAGGSAQRTNLIWFQHPRRTDSRGDQEVAAPED
ncbi:hypothetical protein J4Q44_G00332680 [Coregonus suidteri]|uniref:Peptidase S54 rhomboid domain-containing protein n=1 Tax=Coregonus suidteri TaxID=861788 RepID=A0AAN8L135_9TELE